MVEYLLSGQEAVSSILITKERVRTHARGHARARARTHTHTTHRETCTCPYIHIQRHATHTHTHRLKAKFLGEGGCLVDEASAMEQASLSSDPNIHVKLSIMAHSDPRTW